MPGGVTVECNWTAGWLAAARALGGCCPPGAAVAALSSRYRDAALAVLLLLLRAGMAQDPQPQASLVGIAGCSRAGSVEQ